METRYDKNFFLKLIKNKRNYRGILWFILFYVLFIYSTRHIDSNLISAVTIFQLDNLLSSDGKGLNPLILKTIYKGFFLIIPFLAITLVEISYEKNNSSISKIAKSNGPGFADLWYFILSLVIGRFPVIVTLLSFGISNLSKGSGSFLESNYKIYLPINTNTFSCVFIVILGILITDLSSYIQHRMSHQISFFWDLHEFHHSATEMTIFSNFRNTPIESVLTSIPLLPINIFNGLLISETLSRDLMIPSYLWIIYISSRIISSYLGHSSLKVIYPKPFSYIFMSPSLHWIHHSSDPKHFDTNFGINLTIWDRVFGTYLDESHLKNVTEYGIKGSQYNNDRYNPIFLFGFMPLVKLFKRAKTFL